MKRNGFFSSQKIVREIKSAIKESNFLYEKYLEDNAVASLDPAIQNEFLKDGWSENFIHKGEVVKGVSDTFSFLMNLEYAKKLVISAAITEKDAYMNPIALKMKANETILGKAIIRHTAFKEYVFSIPPRFRKKAVVLEGILKKNRNSSLIIRSIRTYEDLKQRSKQEEVLQELANMRREANHLLQILDWHKNPEYLLPAAPLGSRRLIKKILKRLAAPFKDSTFIKKVVLRLIRPFTTPQIIFNNHLLDILKLQSKRLDQLEKMILVHHRSVSAKKK